MILLPDDVIMYIFEYLIGEIDFKFQVTFLPYQYCTNYNGDEFAYKKDYLFKINNYLISRTYISLNKYLYNAVKETIIIICEQCGNEKCTNHYCSLDKEYYHFYSIIYSSNNLIDVIPSIIN